MFYTANTSSIKIELSQFQITKQRQINLLISYHIYCNRCLFSSQFSVQSKLRVHYAFTIDTNHRENCRSASLFVRSSRIIFIESICYHLEDSY